MSQGFWGFDDEPEMTTPAWRQAEIEHIAEWRAAYLERTGHEPPVHCSLDGYRENDDGSEDYAEQDAEDGFGAE